MKVAPAVVDLSECTPEWDRDKNFKDACDGDNQLVGLATAFLSLRCWDHAHAVLALLKARGIDAVSLPATCAALCSLVEWFTSDLYLPISMARLGLARPLPSPAAQACIPRMLGQLSKAPAGAIRDFAATIAPMMACLTYHVSSSPVLFTKLCRLLRANVAAAMAALPPNAPEAALQAAIHAPLEIVSEHLLPALSVGSSNAFLSSQLWLVLQQVPFQQRFRVYDEWQAKGFGKEALAIGKAPIVAYAEAVALQSARSCLKRLTKDNAKAIGKQLGNVSHACPLVVYNQVLSQVSAYENLIPFVVEALKYSTALSQDTMAYSLVSLLRKGAGKKVKAGETNLSTWFMLLSRFIATFYRKYPSAELKGLLNYLMQVCGARLFLQFIYLFINLFCPAATLIFSVSLPVPLLSFFYYPRQRLSEGDSVDLLVLKDLLLRMGGSDSIVEVSERQLEGLAGGRSIRAEVMGGASREAPSKKAMKVCQSHVNSGMPVKCRI